ncbi:MAG: PAS domain-containing protein, partial [Deltaproteobacteria bacterium]|nr:PAS domain-containing protein [Deltaproteobacteria bacterium]
MTETSRPAPAFCDITSLVRSPCCMILECISDGVFTIDTEKRITSFNRAAAAITGFTPQEAIGRYCFDIFRADICERDCALDRTLAGQSAQINLPARIIGKNGEPKTIRLSTAMLHNEAGAVVGAVETFRDVSELETLRRVANRNFTSEDIVGRDPQIEKILSFLPDIAESESS